MKKLIPCLLGLATLQATASTPDKPFTAEAELGFLMTSGNTESTALKSTLKMRHELTRWRNQYLLEALYKKDRVTIVEDGVSRSTNRVSAEKYFASAQSDYKLDNNHRGLFIFGSYEDDRFSGYEYQASLAAGYSDRLINQPTYWLDISVGPGVSFTRTEDRVTLDGLLIRGETEESAMVRLSARFQYDISDNAKFTQTLSSDVAVESDSNTRSRSETAVTANINSSLALKASLIATHNSEVPAGRRNVDTQSAVTLVYRFK